MEEFAKTFPMLGKDPVIKNLIRQIRLQPIKRRKDHFASLVTSVISQQLSVKAADTIEKRFVALFDDNVGTDKIYSGASRRTKNFPEPKAVLRKSDAQLRKSGLSGSKIQYIKNIARAVEEGKLDFKKLAKASDEEVIQTLVQIKGIGRWTAEMFLIFSLARPDVFSHGDLGLKNAIKKLYKLDPKLHKKKYYTLIESWRPHASTVSRYLWKSLELQ